MASLSPWRGNTLRESITAAETPTSDAAIEKFVKGQTHAVTRVLDILKRTSVGLTGAHASGGASRPRGVLFFVGPTGVGKTEMAKTIARVVFGDASAYKRFDMTEFSSEHSGDRLIGAPPGYVGFDQGGELTNQMRERPFSVLLFDEVEKAHDRLLDKFLQILEDGRLTDGRGETVYFSDALIIFTSNLGISRTLPDGSIEHRIRYDENIGKDEYEKRIMEGVTEHFVRKLGRPELLNRLGENVVVFDFISESVACEILASMVGNVKHRVMEEHGIQLDLTGIHDALVAHCTTDRANGGRGIGSKLEEALVNPLSRLLFRQMPTRGQTLVVTTMSEVNGIHTLDGHAQD
jgi:ATP-dependent Clp protease ATP-binding subunit ClpA